MSKIGTSLKPITSAEFSVATAVEEKIDTILIAEGAFEILPETVRNLVVEKALLMTPNQVFVVDGSEHQVAILKEQLVDAKVMVPLKAYDDNWLVRTDPEDINSVEKMTWNVTADRFETECHTANGVKSIFGHWMDPNQCSDELDARFPKCMTGRTLYVVPFSLGPPGGQLRMSGVLLTDSPYTVLLTIIMCRVCPDVWLDIGEDDEFVSCIHSVGVPLQSTTQSQKNWPCNLEKAFILQRTKERQIWSFGTVFNGGELLSSKCFGLRLASTLAWKYGWLAENMIIIGVTPPGGQEVFVAVALPPGVEKTSFAMMEPSIKCWKVRSISCDIAWLRFGLDDCLYGYNPENGLFAIAPHTSNTTNPQAIIAISKNTIFTNVAETADSEYFWEGLEHNLKDPSTEMTNWEGKKWKLGEEGKAANPNGRYCVPFEQIPNKHPEWEASNGVPISAIVFGSRRSSGMPLIIESFSWQHGVYMAASLRTEFTDGIKHDPMGMGLYVGYNLGKYFEHWLSMDDLGHKLPKIFCMNLFRKDANGKYIWPGFGENIRLLEWIVKRVCGAKTTNSLETAIGIIPTEHGINCIGLPKIDMTELLSIKKEFWVKEAKEIRQFFEQQIGSDLPEALNKEMKEQEKRINEI